MARVKSKAERPAEVRPNEDAAASAFSGLVEQEAPPPVPPKPKKQREAKRESNLPAPAPEVATLPPTKPRARKIPAVVPEALAPAPLVPVVAEVREPAVDLHPQAREAAALLDALLQQCREARTELQREREERQSADRGFDALRQQSQAAHERLLREAEEARRLHEKLLTEAKEARAAHQQLLAQAREGADQVKREHAAAGVEISGVRQQFVQGLEQEISKLHHSLREAGQAIQTLPRHAEDARERLAVIAQAEATRAAAAAKQRAAIDEETRQARLRLESLRAATAQAEASHAAAAKQRETIDEETRQARLRLEALRAENADAENQLAALRLEWAEEQHSHESAKPAPEPIAEESRPVETPPETVAPETHNHLGIVVDPGVVVTEITPGTPAAAAGLVRGDIINSVNGNLVLTGPELRDAILDSDGGEIVLGVIRSGQSTEAKVRLETGDEKSPEERLPLGAIVEPGVVVAEVTPGTPAAAAGLVRGDVITAVNEEEVLTGVQLSQAVQALDSHAEVKLRFTRGGEVREGTTRLDESPATP